MTLLPVKLSTESNQVAEVLCKIVSLFLSCTIRSFPVISFTLELVNAWLPLILQRFTLCLERQISGCVIKDLQLMCLAITKCVRFLSYVFYSPNWSFSIVPTGIQLEAFSAFKHQYATVKMIIYIYYKHSLLK